MNLQNVAKIVMPDGEVKAIHNSNSDLLWGKVNYEVKYSGDSSQSGAPTPDAPVAVQTVTGENTLSISDGTNTQSYKINLGKNLFDKDNANIFNGYLGTSVLRENANGRSVYIPVEAGQTYTFSRANTTSQVNEPYYAFIANEPAEGGQYIGGRYAVGQNLTFTGTAPAGSKYLIFYFAWNPSAETQATILSTYQLEKGSTATSYAPYFTPIELCKIGDYQDYIYKDGSDWKIHKATAKIILTGAENGWSKSNSTANNLYILNSTTAGIGMALNSVLYSNLFTFTTNSVLYNNDSIGMCYNTTGGGDPSARFGVGLSGPATAANFKTWLSSNNVAFYYALATPTGTTITDAMLIAQLEAVEEWLRRYGYNATVSGNLPIIIDRTAL